MDPHGSVSVLGDYRLLVAVVDTHLLTQRLLSARCMDCVFPQGHPKNT